MIGVEGGAAEVERHRAEIKLKFVMTLVVATLIAALAGYVLSYPVLGADRTGSSHGAAAGIFHTRS